MNGGKSVLFDALVSGRGLQHLLDTASGVLRQPLVLCDACWIVRYSSGLMPGQADFLGINRRGRHHLAISVLEQYEKSRQGDKRRIRLPIGTRCCHIRPIGTNDDQMVAYLIMIDDQDRISHEQQSIIEIFCQILHGELATGTRQHLTLQSAQEILLHSWLDGTQPAEIDIPQETFYAGHDQNYLVCVVDAMLENTISAAAMLKLIETIDYEALIIRGGYPVLLIRVSHQTLAAFHDSRDRLASQLARLGRRGGISYPFATIEDFSRYYRQAMQAMKFGAASTDPAPLTAYLDIACLDLAAGCGRTPLQANGLVTPGVDLHPGLQAVIDHDALHGTQYYYTVAACVESGGNIKSSARLLGVRWSTLNNRITRIRELFGLDLKDHAVIRQLYFSCGIESLRRELFR